MHYDVMDLDQGYWEAAMDAFWDYSDNMSMWHLWYQTGMGTKEFCQMYCGV